MRKVLLIGISTFALGAAAMAYADQQGKPPRADTYKMLELFGDVLTQVDQSYVVPVDNKKLIQAALDGMLTSLDPHSGYLDPNSFGDMRDQTRGEYGGLGLQVTAEDGAVKIISPMDDTPAARRAPAARRLHHVHRRLIDPRPFAERRGQADARGRSARPSP